jgi:uncharacterized protein
MEIRKSSYVIDVKLDGTDDKYMLVHGYTGAIDIVSENVVAYLDNISNIQFKDIQISQSTLDSLEKRGYLTVKTEEEEVAFVKKMANVMHKLAKLKEARFGFIVSYDCNFRCPYCYEAKISGHGSKWSKQKFTTALVDKAYAAMLNMQKRREIQIHRNPLLLYGGEPLLKENKDIVSYIVQRGHDLGYRFFAITNGYEIDEYADLLEPSKIAMVQVSIDGWKTDHDKKRIHHKNGGTFDKIIRNIGMALEKGVYVSVRMNTDMKNFDGMHQLGDYFKENGFSDKKNFQFTSSLLVNYLQSTSNKNIEYMSRTEFNRKHFLEKFPYRFEDGGCTNDIERTIGTKKRMKLSPVYCGAQTGEYIFDPYGKIYSCWHSIGKPDAIIGDYNESDIQWYPFLEKILSRNVGNLELCCRCKYALLCRGGCMTVASMERMEITSYQCEDYDATFKTITNKIFSEYDID